MGSVDICRFRTQGTQHAKSSPKRILSRLSVANTVSEGAVLGHKSEMSTEPNLKVTSYCSNRGSGGALSVVHKSSMVADWRASVCQFENA